MAGDTNFYRYVGGDPVNFVDPSGLWAPLLWLAEVIAGLFTAETAVVAGGVAGRIALGKVGQKVTQEVVKKAAAKAADVVKTAAKGMTITGTGEKDPCKSQGDKIDRNDKSLDKEIQDYDAAEDLKGGHKHANGITSPCGHYEEMISYVKGMDKAQKHIQKMQGLKNPRCPDHDTKAQKDKVDRAKKKLEKIKKETSKECIEKLANKLGNLLG
jgi:uncharacterized protein RhaS with RHS repeats